MRILLVCSGNRGEASPFIREQASQLAEVGCVVDMFLIRGKGWYGYLKNRRALLSKIHDFRPDIVHAHSGMSALLAGTQCLAPVVATFHGSDVNVFKLRIFTRIATWLSRAQIVVSADMKRILGKDSVQIIPCAVDTAIFFPGDAAEARSALGWSLTDNYVLFSSAFDNAVKNAPLAKASILELQDPGVHLIELKGKSRSEVALMMNACDVALMTSYSEGSPQFVKEAMACGTPVVSTHVGDVAELSTGVDGHFIVNSNCHEVAQSLRRAIQFRQSVKLTNGPALIHEYGLSPNAVANKLMLLYKSVL